VEAKASRIGPYGYAQARPTLRNLVPDLAVIPAQPPRDLVYRKWDD
jgi:hypothetical protein